jgi:hypothetical protein
VMLRLQHRADGRYLRRLIGDEMNKHFRCPAIKAAYRNLIQMTDDRESNTLTKD